MQHGGTEAQRFTNDLRHLSAGGTWHRLRQSRMAWGDYGDILIHGMAGHLDRNAHGLAQLERTGPFVPPITLPALDVAAVTEDGRRQLDASGLTGFTYRPLTITKVVRLPWHEWDLDADEPAEYPVDGEPEGYLLNGPHDPALAGSVPDMFELVVAAYDSDTDIADGRDLVRIGPYMLLVSERAREWLEARWSRWIGFDTVSP